MGQQFWTATHSIIPFCYTFTIFLYFSSSVYQCNLWGCQPEMKGSIHQCSTATVNTTTIEYFVFEISIIWNIHFDMFYYECFSLHSLKVYLTKPSEQPYWIPMDLWHSCALCVRFFSQGKSLKTALKVWSFVFSSAFFSCAYYFWKRDLAITHHSGKRHC